jgi:hypothetical protein
MSPLQWSIYTHAVAKVLDEKYETIWEGSSKKENVLIMTPEEITEIKQHAEAIAAILYAQTNAEQSILDFRFWILD